MNIILAISFFVLNLIDLIQTKRFLKKGTAEEGNPIIRFMNKHNCMTFFKIIFGLILAVFIITDSTCEMGIMLNVMYSVIVIWNSRF